MASERWIVPIVTWCLSWGLYLVLAGQPSLDEILAGALTGAVAVLLSIVTRHTAERRLSFRRVGWRQLILDTAIALAADTLKVAVALLRISPPMGAFEQTATSSHGSEAERAACNAVLVLSKSIAPNAYVIWGVDHDERLLIHHLSAGQQ